MSFNIWDETGDFGAGAFNTGAILGLRTMMEKLNKPKVYPAMIEFINDGICYRPRQLAREATALLDMQKKEGMREILTDLIKYSKKAKRYIALTT